MNWLSKSDIRLLSGVLSLCILFGSIPLGAGIVIDASSKTPAFTLNICEPAQAGLTVSRCPLARPQTAPHRPVLSEEGKLPEEVSPPPKDLISAPESPPPELFV